jgi:hypothetical protein
MTDRDTPKRSNELVMMGSGVRVPASASTFDAASSVSSSFGPSSSAYSSRTSNSARAALMASIAGTRRAGSSSSKTCA